MTDSVTARAPSSSANLGPGFDVFGLALDAFYDEVRLVKSKRTTIKTDGGVPTDLTHNTAGLVVRAMSRKFRVGCGVDIILKKGVPAGFGMGSSAASAAAAAVAFDGLFGLKLDSDELVRFAGMGERASAATVHYDNVAASIFGGFVIVRGDPPEVTGIRAPRDLIACVAIPQVKIHTQKTKKMRQMVPKTVALTQGVANLANASSMVAGFARGDITLIGNSMRDIIVEPARRRAIPGFDKVKSYALRAGAAGVAISGAGPSVIALASKSSDIKGIERAMRRGFASAGCTCTIITCKPAGGASVRRRH